MRPSMPWQRLSPTRASRWRNTTRSWKWRRTILMFARKFVSASVLRPNSRSSSRARWPASLLSLEHPRLGSIKRRSAMQIKKHDTTHMVELRDGSAWRIWPGDIPKTLQWLPTTEIDVADIDDEICSHALINRSSSRSPQAQELVRLSLVAQFERRPLRRRKCVCLAEPSPIDRNVL